MADKAKIKARVEFLYRTKYLPIYLAFMAVYPFGLEDLPGEIWAWIEGYEGLYKVSTFGRVKRFYGNGKTKILKPWLNRQGYLIFDLCKGAKSKHFPIHQLVARAFIPNPENKPEPNHEDANKMNNHVSNLKWVTRAENQKHAFANGLSPKGEAHHSAKITDEQREEIRRIAVKGDSEFGLNALARKYGISSGSVGEIVNGRKPRKRKKNALKEAGLL